MAVGDEDMGEPLALDRGGDRLQVPLVGGTRVDDGDVAAADDIAIGAEEGVGAGIVGDDAPDARRDLLGDAVVDILAAIEGKLRRHGLLSCWSSRRTRAYCSGAQGGGSAALLAALTFPSLLAQNVARHRHLGPRRRPRRHPQTDAAGRVNQQAGPVAGLTPDDAASGPE